MIGLTLDLRNSDRAPSCGFEYAEPLGCDSDESHASRSAVFCGGTRKV